mmetsp:Transcript_56857/g.182716  ORF Transcript_56857/g.182716 Transcript_56857/m.182716 type:complete len:368 (+) Transcript_56857:98-1201(+)
MEAFLDWCVQRGVQRNGVDVGYLDGCGRCLLVQARVEAEEILVAVPGTAIIGEARHSRNYVSSHWMFCVVHRLLEEDALGPNSAFAPFVHMLLDLDCTDPIDFGKLLDLPGCAGSLARGRAALRQSLSAEFCRAFPGLTADCAARALHAADTRTLYSQKTQMRALVPFFDFMNHSANPNAVWTMDEGGNVQVETLRALDVGEQVLIAYSDSPNASLLVTYGFVLDGDGPHRSVELAVPIPPMSHGGDPEGPRVEQKEVRLRVTATGSLRRRAAMVPLLKAGPAAAAAAIEAVAVPEREAWLRLDPAGDRRLEILRAQSEAALGELLSRIRAWREAEEDTGLMIALGGPPVEVKSSSSDSEGDGSSTD